MWTGIKKLWLEFLVLLHTTLDDRRHVSQLLRPLSPSKNRNEALRYKDKSTVCARDYQLDAWKLFILY